MARFSKLNNPLNKVSSHANISPKRFCEHELVADHFMHFMKNIVLVTALPVNDRLTADTVADRK
jgi:hypothetical protein